MFASAIYMCVCVCVCMYICMYMHTYFQGGEAVFSIAVKPTFFSDVYPVPSSAIGSLRRGNITLRQPFLYMSGTDVDTGVRMETKVQPVHLAMSCVPGSVLSLEAAIGSDGGRQGGCSLCTAGKYSLDPLVLPPGSQDFECFNCPAGGECTQAEKQSAAAVTFAKGHWTVFSGAMYLLQSCPIGHKVFFLLLLDLKFPLQESADGQGPESDLHSPMNT